MYKHTTKLAVKKKNSASIATHIPSNDERQMQLRNIQSGNTTQYRVRLHHLANKNVLKKIGNRMDFEHGRKESSLDLTHKAAQHSSFIF